jgi:hypothetical protein
VNFLLVESLQRFYLFYGPEFQVECPTGSGDYMHLGKVAEEIQHRLQHLFARTDDGRRSINAGNDLLDFDENWRDHMWYYEFFDGDTGRGLGATHQCGWTGLIARMIHDTGYACPLVFMSHYFDDILHRTVDGGRRGSFNSHKLRRSSTARSIGARSDFEGSMNGDDDVRSTTNSVFYEDPERASARAEADSHMHQYISDKLSKYRGDDNNNTNGHHEHAEEFEPRA